MSGPSFSGCWTYPRSRVTSHKASSSDSVGFTCVNLSNTWRSAQRGYVPCNSCMIEQASPIYDRSPQLQRIRGLSIGKYTVQVPASAFISRQVFSGVYGQVSYTYSRCRRSLQFISNHTNMHKGNGDGTFDVVTRPRYQQHLRICHQIAATHLRKQGTCSTKWMHTATSIVDLGMNPEDCHEIYSQATISCCCCRLIRTLERPDGRYEDTNKIGFGCNGRYGPAVI